MRYTIYFILHNAVSHPLLCLSNRKSSWPDQFHDWTAKKMEEHGEPFDIGKEIAKANLTPYTKQVSDALDTPIIVATPDLLEKLVPMFPTAAESCKKGREFLVAENINPDKPTQEGFFWNSAYQWCRAQFLKNIAAAKIAVPVSFTPPRVPGHVNVNITGQCAGCKHDGFKLEELTQVNGKFYCCLCDVPEYCTETFELNSNEAKVIKEIRKAIQNGPVKVVLHTKYDTPRPIHGYWH